MSHNTCEELECVNKVYDPVWTQIKYFGVSEKFARNTMSKLSCFANQYCLSGPDLSSKHNKEIIGVEHYEYVASRKNRKGSKERQEIERANSKFLKEAHAAAQEGKDLTMEYRLDANASVDTLKSNFLRGFKKHQKKINIYKENLEEIYGVKDVPIWFVAEDTSVNGPMFNHGSVIIHDQPNFPLLPVFYKDIQEEILNSNIMGIIILSAFPISNYVVFIKNKSKSFKSLMKYYSFNEDLPIRFFNDTTYGFHSFCAFDAK